jgi:hypothetical protein
MKLFPRLPHRSAEQVYSEQQNLPLDQLMGASSHRQMVWPATGAERVGDAELDELGSRLRDSAVGYGYPQPLAPGDQYSFDLALARVLWETVDLTPAEAGFGDVWSFLALALVPDVVWWRAAGSTNLERFVATDLTRHTLARLWWRAQLFTWGLDDPEEGWALWKSTAIGEAELDQIQTRRRAYGSSPRAFRTLVRIYPTVTTLADELGVDRRTFWRQSYLRWLLRLGAFINLSGMPEAELKEDLLLLAHELAAAHRSGSDTAEYDRTDEEEEQEEAASSGDDTFDSLPLSTLVVRLTEAVRAAGQVERKSLASAFERASGIAVPPARAAILTGIAWHGQRLEYLVHTGGDAQTIWHPGSVLPAPDRRWGEWSMDSFKTHVAGLNGGGDFDSLCADLFDGRAGTTVKRIVRAALEETEG